MSSSLVEQLLQKGFQLKDRVDHHSLVYFLIEYIGKKNKIMFWFKALNAMLFLLSVVLYFIYKLNEQSDNLSMLLYFSAGLLSSLLSVPFHEAIHGIGFLITGAKKISFKAQWKKLMFMACAHHHVMNWKKFFFVAFLPCAVFLMAGLIGIILFYHQANYTILILGFLLAHTFFCIGDFALCGYFLEHGTAEVVTYDDMEENATYFFTKSEF
ncbi:MAG TPA: DUF3267 domain-containing protein [Bacteroidia bacterium]|nr:DUF3267 domain-containing protein [Bacteroidia bacterium]